MTENSLQITLSKKGLLIYSAILIFFDMLSTYLVARTSLESFLQFEVNPFMKWAFMHMGWVSFLVYPIIPFLLYFIMISAGFGTYNYFNRKGQGKIVKGYFYFLFTYVTFHLIVIINNLTLFYVLTCK
jgi:hypothetical protein